MRGFRNRYLDRFPRVDACILDRCVSLNDLHLEFLPGTAYHHIEVTAECSNSSQSHAWPAFRQAGRAFETVEPGRQDTKHPLRKNAAIEPALGSEMALPSFGIRFDSIWDMLTQQAPPGVLTEKIQGFRRFTSPKHGSEGIQRGAVPEHFVARLRRQSVRGPHARRKQGVYGALFAIEYSHRERHADP